ncbi:MAG: cyclic peptide export ABC transporter [Thermoanaerobaculia bacterium]
MLKVSGLFSFLLRIIREAEVSKATAGLIVGASLLGGAASAALIGVINSAVHRTAPESRLLWIFVGLCAALPLLRFTSSYLLLRMTQDALLKLRLHLCRLSLVAPLRELERIGTSRMMPAITEDLSTLGGFIGSIPLLVMQAAVVVGCIVYVGTLSWVLLLVLIAFVLLGVVTYQLPAMRAQKYFRGAREVWDRLFAHLRGITDGAKELKIHHARRKAFFEEQLQPDFRRLRDNSLAGQALHTAAGGWGQVLFFILIGVLLFGFSGKVDERTLTGFTLAILFIRTPLDSLLTMIPTVARASIAAEKIQALDRELDATALPAEMHPPAPIPSWSTLELRSAAHTYRGESDDEFILGPLDLTLRPGELVFLIGGNGSGKTTLAKLLIGLYKPEQGEILLDGQRITDDNRDAYRQLFSVVFSDFYLFDSLLGLTDPQIDVQALHYLARLELDRNVRVRNGVLSTLKLSQGQRKRLALLTAYLEDRPIYVFDEWAADQDPRFKRIFYEELLPELRQRGKTVIVISHDDHYYHVAERFIKLSSGRLEYDGNASWPLAEAQSVAPAVGAE